MSLRISVGSSGRPCSGLWPLGNWHLAECCYRIEQPRSNLWYVPWTSYELVLIEVLMTVAIGTIDMIPDFEFRWASPTYGKSQNTRFGGIFFPVNLLSPSNQTFESRFGSNHYILLLECPICNVHRFYHSLNTQWKCRLLAHPGPLTSGLKQ